MGGWIDGWVDRWKAPLRIKNTVYLAIYLTEYCLFGILFVQVETASCYESLDEVLSVPGITSAFLGKYWQ